MRSRPVLTNVVRAPFVYRELLARVRALLARDLANDSEVLRYGPLEVDTGARQATFDSEPLPLRRLELALLAQLARAPRRVYTKHELLREVWGCHSEIVTRTMDPIRTPRVCGASSRLQVPRAT
jgi:DNA-binding response OmpR family regulator